MPFLDDSGIDDSIDRGPLWSAFATFGAQLEKMIVVNIVWALQFAPAVLALIFMRLPDPIRLILVLYTVVAIPPATAVLYGLVVEAARHESLDVGLARELFNDLWLAGYKSLAPLMGFLGFVVWSINQANAANLFFISVLLQVFLLLLVLSANYWGGLLVESPQQSALGILWRSWELVWQYPANSLLLGFMVALALVIGMISIGGLVLAVPVIIALLQVHMMKAISRQSSDKSSHRKKTAWDN